MRGDVVQQLLPLIDNFELARTQVRASVCWCACGWRRADLGLRNAARCTACADPAVLVRVPSLPRVQVKAETEGEIKINNSYQGLYKQFVDLLRSLGIEAVPTTGTPFDPAIHEAIMREPNDEVRACPVPHVGARRNSSSLLGHGWMLVVGKRRHAAACLSLRRCLTARCWWSSARASGWATSCCGQPWSRCP